MPISVRPVSVRAVSARRRTAVRFAWIAAACVVILGAGAVGDATGALPGPLVLVHAPAPPPPLPAAATRTPTPAVALPPLSATAPLPSPAALSATLTPLLAAGVLGGEVGASVIDASTGRVLFDAGGTTPRRPASVAKLLTAAAVLSTFGPDAHLATRVVAGPDAGGQVGTIVLVGGGDVLLSAGAGRPDAVDGRAGLADLATQTTAALRAAGTTSVTLQLDDTLVGSAPAIDPTWGAGDVASGFVAPLGSLAVDAGRTAAGRYAPRSPDPAMAAATTFASLLTARGITVTGPPQRSTTATPGAARTLARVQSAPLSDVLAYTLAESDNTVAESLARQVGHARGAAPTFASSGAAVVAADRAAGLDVDDVTLVDGSGLGAGSAVPAQVLAGILAAAAGVHHPALRPLLLQLPVGGLSGTLDDRFMAGSAEDAGSGLVRAKTGTLTGVNSLAGTLVDADGRQLVFAVLADHVSTAPGGTDAARAAVDAVPDALVTCGCR